MGGPGNGTIFRMMQLKWCCFAAVSSFQHGKLAAFNYMAKNVLKGGGFREPVRTKCSLSPSESKTFTEWNPQVVRISRVSQHPNADALDVVTVLKDYPVVVKRNEYKVGDLASYIPIDTIVPDKQEFHFLCPPLMLKYVENGEITTRPNGPSYPVGSVPEKYRIIKAKKIRGVYSQGILRPAPPGSQESESVVEDLELKRWEEQEEENIPGVVNEFEAPPQGWKILYYDVAGIRRFLDCLTVGEEIVLTEKLHGSNAAFVHDGARLWVKSRNHYKKMNSKDVWWDVALRYDLEAKLQRRPNMVVFGEIYGLVRGFRYDTVFEGGRLLPRVRFFDVWDTAALRFLDFDDRISLLAELGLDPVPVLYRGPWLGRDEMYQLAEGPTTLGRHVREGWVLNTAKERFEPLLGSRMQVRPFSRAPVTAQLVRAAHICFCLTGGWARVA